MLTSMIDYTLYFFLYSALGFLLETAWAAVFSHGSGTRRTLLHLPICPVYGIGGVLMARLAPLGANLALRFALGFFAASAAEYAYSLYYEKRFGILWWDYSSMAGNVGGRVCVFYSLCWGVVGAAFYGFVHPTAAAAVTSAGVWYKAVLAFGLMVMFWRDLTATHRELRDYVNGKSTRAGEIFAFLRKK